LATLASCACAQAKTGVSRRVSARNFLAIIAVSPRIELLCY
jgi:hypothetical protein